MSNIVTLKDNTTSQPIYPLTSTKAVVDDLGNSVDALIQEIHQDSEDFVVTEDPNVGNIEVDDSPLDLTTVALRKTPQELSESEKTQARQNIDAANGTETKDELNKLFINMGLDNIETYSMTKYYYPGDTVVYDKILYRFTKEHPDGFWEITHVKRISIVDIILEKLKGVK